MYFYCVLICVIVVGYCLRVYHKYSGSCLECIETVSDKIKHQWRVSSDSGSSSAEEELGEWENVKTFEV